MKKNKIGTLIALTTVCAMLFGCGGAGTTAADAPEKAGQPTAAAAAEGAETESAGTQSAATESSGTDEVTQEELDQPEPESRISPESSSSRTLTRSFPA